ncbi:MAG: hypothetical protein IPI53_17775 [Saprospiraceae bacterium]|nr:hypothetical protein [Saprospiraceae bacterium]
MSKLRKNTEFYVNLNDVQLSKESISRIESKIQSAVMDELLAYKPIEVRQGPRAPFYSQAGGDSESRAELVGLSPELIRKR